MKVLLAKAVCFLLFMASGCAEIDDIGGLQQANTVYLPAPHQVLDDDVYDVLLSHSFTLGAGEAVYLSGWGDPTSNQILGGDKLRVKCGAHAITSSKGRLSYAAEGQRARMLFAPASAGTYTCELQARNYDYDGANGHHDTYDQDTSFGHSANLAPGNWSHWGTENDNFREDCGDGSGQLCTFIGPHTYPPDGAGEEEYILRSPRFEVSSSATALDVYSEPQLTTCYEGTQSCPPYRQGEEEDGHDAVVQLRLLVQQMCSPTSSAVGHVSYYPPTGNLNFPVLYDMHHKKAHLVINGVEFRGANECSSCPGSDCVGRSFKVKTLVEWVSGPDIQINYGTNGTIGYSTSFAFAN